MIHDKKNLLSDDELVIVKGLLKESNYTCLYIISEHPREFKALGHVLGDHF